MRRLLALVVICLLLIGGVYGLFVYEKKKIVESVENDIVTALSSGKFIITDVKIDPDKVHLNIMSLFPDWMFDVAAEDVEAEIKSLGGDGRLKVSNIKMQYPLFGPERVGLCRADNTALVYGDEEIAVNFSLDSITSTPCIFLNEELSPMSVALGRVTVELKDKKERENWNVVRAEIDSASYSIRGDWKKLPKVEAKDDLDTVIKKLKKWILTSETNGDYTNLWALTWEMTDFSLNLASPTKNLDYGTRKTTLMTRGFLDEKKRIGLELTYKMQGLVVRDMELSEQLRQVGLDGSDLWPASGSFTVRFGDLPVEMVAMGLILQEEAKKEEPNDALLGYLFIYFMNLMAQKEFPLHFETSLELPGNAGARANVDGTISKARFAGNGVLRVTGLGRLLQKTAGSQKDEIEAFITKSLNCDSSRETCHGKIEISDGSFRVYPEDKMEELKE